jgi:DNA-binding phage protein
VTVRDQWIAHATKLKLRKTPILCGPWRSEVGYEILYWLPFLHCFLKTYGIDPARMIAIGRGGSAAWYQFPGSADLYEFLPVETVRQFSLQSRQKTGSINQHTEEDWERQVTRLAARSLGLEKYSVLSPSWMYRLLAPYWEGKRPIKWLDKYLLQPVRLTAPPLPDDLLLPETFIAMRWYARATWPHREDLVLWSRRLVEKVSAHVPVVLIDAPHMDDHGDINLGDIPNTTRLSQIANTTALNNLAVQTAVIAKAKGYIGTYGGMSQAALRFGVPTIALYDSFEQTSPAHLQLTHDLSLKTNIPFISCQYKQLYQVLPVLVRAKDNG